MQTSDDPYENFILQHLKHYGLFKGQRSTFLQKNVSAGRLWDIKHDSVAKDIHHSTADSTDMDEEQPQAHQGQFSFNMEKYLRTRQLLIDLDGGKPIPRLREPLDLFSIPSISRPFQGVCWPIECEVVCDKIHHIEWEPPEPEPFYQQTGYEQSPMPVGEEKGITIYCVDSATKMSCFTRSRVGGSRRHIKNFTSSADSQETPTLCFESRFESGNLQKAVKIGHYDYELTLRNDMYTTKHTQWFYFRVKNMKAGVTYRFTIINLMKSSSLYEAGMRPLLYSELGACRKGEGWYRTGNNIRYYRNESEKESHPLYSLTWTLEFPYENDTCYLAHCYPYTYSDLQHYLQGVASDPARAMYCKVRVLCRSLAGNSVYVLTITAPCGTWEERRNRQAVVVTARVHPGETNSSWMMQGFLEFLLGKSPDAHLLRETFVFKIVPMLNPDGVVVGNYRCSLTGRDMNRNYRTLLKESFPCVWYTRNMVKRLLAEREVVLYCDLHGHSRKNNVFMYGCTDRKDTSLHLQERVFPLMMSKNANDKFSFRSCKFKMQKGKEGTGRIVMWRLGIRNSYTMESTFGGSTLGGRRGTHFSVGDLKSMGYHLCDTLLDFCDPDQAKTENCLKELGVMLKQEIRRKLGREVDCLDGITDVDIESSTSGSNSTDSDGLPAHLLNRTDQDIKVKKKHLRSRKERNRLRQQGAVQQSAKSRTLHRDNKITDRITSNEDQVIERMQEKISPVKEGKNQKPNAQLVRINQSGKTWITHPIPRVSLVGHETFWEDKKDKNGLGYSPPLLDETGRLINHTRRQAQHHCVTAVPHRLSCLPIQQFPMLFNKDDKAHPGMRGRSAVSKIALHRVVPEFISVKELELNRSAYSSPAHTLNQYNIRQKRTPQSTKVSLESYIPEIPNTMGTPRTNHKRNVLAGQAVLGTEQSREAEQLNKQERGNYSFFPDLRSINRPRKRNMRSFDVQAGLRALRLETLSGGHEDAASSGSWSSEEGCMLPISWKQNKYMPQAHKATSS
ncbi:cytosolic carboxypeptidase 2 isoform X1 [Tachysurus fulvidraco]|uniref:cytosolic carboxypeptidase 2 isoform X1 n=1 Tax=Tachysurus fulvidraco TaxID=1234273 RepID=UPI001FEDBFBF|nr:cytosolic carboxypeptidase 2 isoform X1 [Tachysurus fulvidraco]